MLSPSTPPFSSSSSTCLCPTPISLSRSSAEASPAAVSSLKLPCRPRRFGKRCCWQCCGVGALCRACLGRRRVGFIIRVRGCRTPPSSAVGGAAPLTPLFGPAAVGGGPISSYCTAATAAVTVGAKPRVRMSFTTPALFFFTFLPTHILLLSFYTAPRSQAILTPLRSPLASHPGMQRGGVEQTLL